LSQLNGQQAFVIVFDGIHENLSKVSMVDDSARAKAGVDPNVTAKRVPAHQRDFPWGGVRDMSRIEFSYKIVQETKSFKLRRKEIKYMIGIDFLLQQIAFCAYSTKCDKIIKYISSERIW